MKRQRSTDYAADAVSDAELDRSEDEQQLDPLAAALLALGGNHHHHLQWQRKHAGRRGGGAARHEDDMLVSGPADDPSSGLPAARRGYVWRGPHRQELTLHKQQQQQQQAAPLQPAVAGPAHNSGSSHRSSVTMVAIPSDDDEVAQQQQQPRPRHPNDRFQQQHQHQWQHQRHQQSRQGQLQERHQQQQKQQQRQQPASRDTAKEWAALTTWLRMNLHNPRTPKRVMLFVGQEDAATGCWTFSLNPVLTWADVSMETRLRLKMLPIEAEQSFARKYPGRPRNEWGSKVQRYRPPGSSTSSAVKLLDVVNSLHQVYLQHESDAAAVPSPSSTAVEAPQLLVAPPPPQPPQQAGDCANAGASAVYQQAHQPQLQQEQQQPVTAGA